MAVKSATKEDRYLTRYAARNATPNSDGEKQKRFTNDDELNQWLDGQERKAADRSATYQKDNKEEKDQHEQDKNTEAKLKRVDERSKKTHNKAERDPDVKEQEKKEQKEQEKKEKERQEARDTLTGLVTENVKDAIDSTTKKVGDAAFSVSNWTTPGGIGLLVVILLLLAATVVQVNANGDTRLKQWWYMLTGRAQLAGKVTPIAGGIPYTDTPSLNVALGTILPQIIDPIVSTVASATPIAHIANDVNALGQYVQGIGNAINSNASQFRSQFGGLP